MQICQSELLPFVVSYNEWIKQMGKPNRKELIKMKKQYRIFSVLSALVMVIICTAIMPAIAFAAEQGSNFPRSESETILTVDQLVGQSAASVDSLGGRSLKSNDITAPQISDMSLFYEDGKLVLKGSLTYEGQTVALESHGDFYKKEKTENAATYGDLVLGEMSDCGNIHFVQLRIDKQEPKMSIFLQDKNSKQIFYFEMPIDNDMFDEIYSLPNHQLSGTDLEKKIVQLYSVSGNLMDQNSNSGGHGSSSSPAVSTNDVKVRSTWFQLLFNIIYPDRNRGTK